MFRAKQLFQNSLHTRKKREKLYKAASWFSFSFRNRSDLPHELNLEVIFFSPLYFDESSPGWAELKVCGNNRYIPVSSACKTMATQSKRAQQPIRPNPQGVCANSGVSRVEAACSGILPVSPCSGRKAILNHSPQTCWRIIEMISNIGGLLWALRPNVRVIFVLLLVWQEWHKERDSQPAFLLVLAIVLRAYP